MDLYIIKEISCILSTFSLCNSIGNYALGTYVSDDMVNWTYEPIALFPSNHMIK